MGGLRRLVTALRREASPIVLDNGGLSGGTSRQETMKAETAAHARDLTKVGAANFTGRDARLGRAEVRDGQATVNLPAYTRKGAHSLVVTYLGTEDAAGSQTTAGFTVAK